MYFQALSNDRKYELNVVETRSHWRIDIKEGEQDWIHYNIDKKDYQVVEDAISFIFKNSSYLVDVTGRGTEYTVYTRGAHSTIEIFNEERLLHESLKGGAHFGRSDNLTSGMPGKIVKIFVKPGDIVHAGDPLLIMEAMKMENEMRAPTEVKVKEILVKPGDNVESGVVLITFEKL